MIGTPKIIGSPIPKKDGSIPIRPTVFNCFDFERTSRIANANREPQPPIMTKYTQNGVVNTCGRASPAAFAAALIDRFPSRIGPNTPAKAASWIPKNQKKCTSRVIITVNRRLSAAWKEGAIAPYINPGKVVLNAWNTAYTAT